MSQITGTSLHTYKACFTLDDLKRLIQSCIFLTEHVFVPSAVTPAPHLGADVQAQIARQLTELREIGAVKFWDIEGQTDFLRSACSLPAQYAAPDVVIPRGVYKEIYMAITERLVANRNYFLGTAMAGSLDGIAEFVLGKHVLWTLALSEYLRTGRIIFDPVAASNTRRYFTDLLSVQTTDQVIDKLMCRMSMPDVTMLSPRQIAECRKFLPELRRDVEKRVAESERLPFPDEELVERIANRIMDEFFDEVHKLSQRNQVRELAWSLFRLLFSRNVPDRDIGRFTGWFATGRAELPVFSLLEVRRVLRDGRPSGT